MSAHPEEWRGQGRIFHVAHNRNHVEIFQKSRQLLLERGVSVICVAVEGFVPPAEEEFYRLGLPFVTLEEMKADARPGDVVVVGNDWLPPSLCATIQELKRAGIKTVAFVEGCRFILPNKYARVDELLGWGPSARTLPAKRVHVVGSPVLERILSAPRAHDAKLTLVNYRFKLAAAEEGGIGSEWLEKVVAACTLAGSNIAISAHPASGLVDKRYQVSALPIEELLRRSALLVSRCSTIIYQALVLGVPAVLFPTTDEELGEFAEPMGAFPIAKGGDDLIEIVRTRFRGESKYDPSVFLAHHVDMDLVNPASSRIADALLTLLK